MKQKILFLAIGLLLGVAGTYFFGFGMVGRYEPILDETIILDTVTGETFGWTDRFTERR